MRLEGDANSPAKVYTKDEIKILGQPRRREQKEPVDDELKKLEDQITARSPSRPTLSGALHAVC